MGANPTPIPWGETPAALKQGVADALDPSIAGLEIFGFQDSLSWITELDGICDAGAYSVNLKWFKSLPSKTQNQISEAAAITTLQNKAKIPVARTLAKNILVRGGVQFYRPSSEERKLWVEKCGYQLPYWRETIENLVPSQGFFNELVAAAGDKEGCRDG